MMIQLGVTPTPNGPAADGYGEFVTVEKLEMLERQRVREQLAKVRPELLAEGIRVVRAKTDADAAYEKLRKDLQLAVSVDGLRAALAMISEEAGKQAAIDAAKAKAVASAPAAPSAPAAAKK